MARQWHRIILFRLILAVLGTGQAIAQTDPADKLASGFTDLAGSRENAIAIVRGMATGKVIALRAPAEGGGRRVIAFNMADGPLAWSDVEATLARVRTRFADAGVTRPTVEQLQAALVPGISEGARADRPASSGVPRVVSAPLMLASAEVPERVATAWGRYRPSERASNRFEKFPGIN